MFRRLIVHNVRKNQYRPISTLRITSNFKLVTGQIFNRPGGTFIKRVGIIIGAYMVINVMFNLMLFVLSVNYISKIQLIPSSFKWMTRYKFLQSVISDDVLMKPKEAHQEYGKILETLSELSDEELATRSEDFVGGYCDLLLRYALSSNDSNVLQKNIKRAFEIIDKYHVGNASLQNQALRTMASLQSDLESKESYYKRAIELVSDIEFTSFGIVPPKTVISQELLQSLLDLTYFYTDNKLQMDHSLSILLSILRSLEFDKAQKLHNLQRDKSSHLQKQVTHLENELIPMIKSNISEILWFDKNYAQAIKWCQESALESLINARENYNSARICKNSFKNLSSMYHLIKDEENSKLCSSKADSINLLIPMNTQSVKLRDVVLDHYFGYWGKILFP